MKFKIPFNKPFIIGREIEYIKNAVESGQLASNGIFTKKCQELLMEKTNSKKILLTHSCTGALEMSALLTNICPGDEVIMPSFTFVSTANAFALRGAIINFADIREDTLNLDETLLEDHITRKTKAIVPVHYAGVSCNMDVIMEIAKTHHLYVIEDSAQAVDSYYKGTHLGTFGHLGCFSFHETKNLISGEGGAIVINDDELIDRAQIVWEKGTNRTNFINGLVDKYSWVDYGSSYGPSELISAFLLSQLESWEEITQQRKAIWNCYNQGLMALEKKGFLRLPTIPPECRHNGHMYYIICGSNKERTKLISYLKQNSVMSVFHYVPLHTSQMAKKLFPNSTSLPVTDHISSVLLRLPCYYGLSLSEARYVVSLIEEFYK